MSDSDSADVNDNIKERAQRTFHLRLPLVEAAAAIAELAEPVRLLMAKPGERLGRLLQGGNLPLL